jgi:hypothetical protein
MRKVGTATRPSGSPRRPRQPLRVASWARSVRGLPRPAPHSAPYPLVRRTTPYRLRGLVRGWPGSKHRRGGSPPSTEPRRGRTGVASWRVPVALLLRRRRRVACQGAGYPDAPPLLRAHHGPWHGVLFRASVSLACRCGMGRFGPFMGQIAYHAGTRHLPHGLPEEPLTWSRPRSGAHHAALRPLSTCRTRCLTPGWAACGEASCAGRSSPPVSFPGSG